MSTGTAQMSRRAINAGTDGNCDAASEDGSEKMRAGAWQQVVAIVSVLVVGAAGPASAFVTPWSADFETPES